MSTYPTEQQLHAAMDAFYPGEDWRVALGIALPNSLRDMRAALIAASAVSGSAGEDPETPDAGVGALTWEREANRLREVVTKIRDFAKSSILVQNDALDLVCCVASRALAQPAPVGEDETGVRGALVDALVDRFADAMKTKLRASEAKYGWQNGWLKPDWQVDCQRDLARHVAKGDPLDVAAYAAFCWHHEWKTARDPNHMPPVPRPRPRFPESRTDLAGDQS